MTIFQIESWARDVIERLVAGGHVEDLRVEMKAIWPTEHREVARRIGGQANAARGEPILYLVGVDEKSKTVSGAPQANLADWWPQVTKHFDSFAPPMRDHAFGYNGQTVVALQMETDGAPFVVKTAGGAVSHEVPWRHATGIRSATRADLFALLSPKQRTPDIEVMAARLRVLASEEKSSRRSVDALVMLYVSPRSNENVVIPDHRSSVNVKLRDDRPWLPMDFKFLQVSGTIFPSGGQTTVSGPGVVQLACDLYLSRLPDEDLGRPARLSMEFGLVSPNAAIPIELQLSPKGWSEAAAYFWECGDSKLLPQVTFYDAPPVADPN